MACQSFNHGQENCAVTLCGDQMKAYQMYSMAVVINLSSKNLRNPRQETLARNSAVFVLAL